MTRGRERNVAESLDDVRRQWVEMFGRDRADLGPSHAAGMAAEAIDRYGPMQARYTRRTSSPRRRDRSPTSPTGRQHPRWLQALDFEPHLRGWPRVEARAPRWRRWQGFVSTDPRSRGQRRVVAPGERQRVGSQRLHRHADCPPPLLADRLRKVVTAGVQRRGGHGRLVHRWCSHRRVLIRLPLSLEGVSEVFEPTKREAFTKTTSPAVSRSFRSGRSPSGSSADSLRGGWLLRNAPTARAAIPWVVPTVTRVSMPRSPMGCEGGASEFAHLPPPGSRQSGARRAPLPSYRSGVPRCISVMH
jgi:hypothetical protein